MRDALRKGLEARKIAVREQGGDRLELTYGQGLMAQKREIDLGPVLERLEGQGPGEVETRRLVVGYIQGVHEALSEPKKSRASQWSYELSAGKMMLSLQVETYVAGVLAVRPEEPVWHAPFVDDVVAVVVVELDRGLRPLSTDQVTRWGATDDRIFSAARSMLFHKTRDLPLGQMEGFPGVFRLSKGDGYDAARAFVAADAYYSEVDESKFEFAIPHQDALLFIQQERHRESLRAAAQQEAMASECPLSFAALKLERTGRPPRAKRV